MNTCFTRGFKMLIDTTAPKKSTKELILEVSLKLFSKKGYTSTSVRDIVADVGIIQSGLYNHFRGKEAILEALIGDLMSSAIVKIFKNTEVLRTWHKRVSPYSFRLLQRLNL